MENSVGDRFYETDDEINVLNTVFKDKPEDWKVTRKWIHSNPMQAKTAIATLSNQDPRYLDILHDPELWLRPEQLVEWDVETILYLAGRGWGKTHSSSNILIKEAMKEPNQVIALFGADFNSLKRVNWGGDSGILKAIHPSILKNSVFNKSDLSLVLPNGTQILSFSAESSGKSRGMSAHMVVADELASWTYAQEALDDARLILRSGRNPRLLITTTPRPTQVIKDLASDPDVKLIKGITSMNYFLPASYEEGLKKKLTERLYRQECLAEILDDNLFAMFQMNDIMATRVKPSDFDFDSLRRIVVGVDPAVTANENSDLTGIVVVGQDNTGHCYVLEDASMQMASPEKWADEVIRMYNKYNKYPADVRIVAEKNQGGDMVSTIIRNAAKRKMSMIMPPVKLVHATKGKEVRAEPIAAVYERHEVHHVGEFSDLELEMTNWNPTEKNSKSPDRMDALCWACTELTKFGTTQLDSGYNLSAETGSSNPYST